MVTSVRAWVLGFVNKSSQSLTELYKIPCAIKENLGHLEVLCSCPLYFIYPAECWICESLASVCSWDFWKKWFSWDIGEKQYDYKHFWKPTTTSASVWVSMHASKFPLDLPNIQHSSLYLHPKDARLTEALSASGHIPWVYSRHELCQSRTEQKWIPSWLCSVRQLILELVWKALSPKSYLHSSCLFICGENGRRERAGRWRVINEIIFKQQSLALLQQIDILHQCCGFDFYLSLPSLLAHRQGSFFY